MNPNLSEKQTKLDILLKDVNSSYISTIKSNISKIFRVFSDPDATATELKNVIENDPPLYAKVLKYANSAYYGSRREISEIKQAIICLGFNTVKELALTQKVCTIFEKEEKNKNFSLLDLWKHSISVAICGRLIYRREFREKSDLIYTAGILHDIGIIIEDQFRHEAFEKIIVEANETHEDTIDIENRLLGYNHSDIGEAIAQDWEFPYELCDAIGTHHIYSKDSSLLSKVLAISEYICQSEDIGFCDTPYINLDLYNAYVEELDIEEEAIDLIKEKLILEVNRMEEQGWF